MSDELDYPLRLVKHPDGRMEWRDDAPSSLAPAQCSAARWSVKPIFAWYDLWVGIFWDSRKRKLYILPVPCVGVVIEIPMRQNDKAQAQTPGHDDRKKNMNDPKQTPAEAQGGRLLLEASGSASEQVAGMVSKVHSKSRDFDIGETVRVKRVFDSGCMIVVGGDGKEAYVAEWEVAITPNDPDQRLGA